MRSKEIIFENQKERLEKPIKDDSFKILMAFQEIYYKKVKENEK